MIPYKITYFKNARLLSKTIHSNGMDGIIEKAKEWDIDYWDIIKIELLEVVK